MGRLTVTSELLIKRHRLVVSTAQFCEDNKLCRIILGNTPYVATMGDGVELGVEGARSFVRHHLGHHVIPLEMART
jgi:hypothetical protein